MGSGNRLARSLSGRTRSDQPHPPTARERPREETRGLNPKRFGLLRPVGRIWAIAAVRGEAARLRNLHAEIAKSYQYGDRLVYLGDILGVGPDVRGAVDELLRFRRQVLAVPPYTAPDDVVVLRGCQEEMWRNLVQIQFTTNPSGILEWMEARGIEASITAYGGSLAEGRAAAKEGATALSQWTTSLRNMVRATPGHAEFQTMMRHAALTPDGGLLFVNAGLDPALALAEQGDNFWWKAQGLDGMQTAYSEGRFVVRGADSERRGLYREPFYLNLDEGCGEGGPLNAVCLSATGEALSTLSV